MKKYFKNKQGYTIIETMIALSLFIIIVMAGMTALLNANLLHKKSQSMREVMDNLSFIMEDMSRNLRTGYNYKCSQNGDLNSPEDCVNGKVIVFEEAHGHTPTSTPADLSGNDQWIYKIEPPNIFKSIDGGSTWVQLNPDEVAIDPESFFSVVGAEPPPDILQPFVTIKLVGTININNNVVTPFSLQTSVSQRLIDI